MSVLPHSLVAISCSAAATSHRSCRRCPPTGDCAIRNKVLRISCSIGKMFSYLFLTGTMTDNATDYSAVESLLDIVKRKVSVAQFRHAEPLELIVAETAPGFVDFFERWIFCRFFRIQLIRHLECSRHNILGKRM